MKIESKEVMLERIRTGKYHITKTYESDEIKWYISSGKGQKMTFKHITEERAMEWLRLGADLIEL